MTGSSLPSSKDEKQNTKTQTNLTTNPPRWNTPEFYFYYLCFIIIVPYMFYIAHSVSKETNPHYPEYASRLSDGWIFGRKVDNSDAQYAHFRDNLPKLLLLSILFVGFNRLMSVFTKGTVKGRLQLLSFTSLIVVVGLHGTSAIKILIIISTSYLIGRFTGGSKLNPILSWAFNLGILFLNEAHNGYTFTSIHSQLDWLDEYPGISPRWHILFNFVMLRLISYNMDYYWQIKKPRLEYKNDDDLTTVALSDRDRIDIPCNSSDYNYIYFLAYVLYTPLYMCGPILTYNDFISQLYIPSPHVTRRFVTIYGLRLVGVILVMEWTLHYIYVVAISKERAWDGDTPLELSMIGYFNLVIIWMKLLILWRFFRLWALVDGIWTEENMVRCMSNNFSAQRFWKSWHRTFNRWLIRYVYIPLGGAKYFMFNMWIVFTFVALWHDIELKLLAWGWLICLFLLPEIIASQLFSYKKFGHKWYYRFVCGIGAVGNILMMMIANLVGFCVGLDGMKDMLVQIFGTVDGLIYLFSVICTLFVGVQVMFEIRESEKRRGDKRYLM